MQLQYKEDPHLEIWKEAQRELARKKKVEELRMRKQQLVSQCIENFYSHPKNYGKDI